MDLYEEIEKSFPKIEKLFTESSLREFAQTPYSLLGKYQAGLGTVIRLRLLRRNSILYKAFLSEGVLNSYDMTLVLFHEFRKHLLVSSEK